MTSLSAATLLALRLNEIEELKISHEEMGDEATLLLGEALRINTSLKRLKLIECGIAERGANALADSLRQNSTLTSFLFISDRCTPDATKALIESLGGIPSLTLCHIDPASTLSLSLKQITDLNRVNMPVREKTLFECLRSSFYDDPLL